MKKCYSILLAFCASLLLSGCVVANDGGATPVVTTSVGVVGSNAVFYYSLDDGYYYDHAYRRLPYNYRPDRYARIHRIRHIDDYRRHHGVWQGQPNRIEQNRAQWHNRRKHDNAQWHNRRHNENRLRIESNRNNVREQHNPDNNRIRTNNTRTDAPSFINRQTGQRIQGRSYPSIRRGGDVRFRSNSSSNAMRPYLHGNRMR